MSDENEAAQISQGLNNASNMSLSQLQGLSNQIGDILGRGEIRTECKYKNYKEKYEITTRDGVEISRTFINSTYEGDSSKIESVPLSSSNVSDLQAAQNCINNLIQNIQNIHSSIKSLRNIANNENNQIDIDKALDLTMKFLGPLENEGKLSNRSDSLVRFISLDGKRQVRWDIEPKQSHCKGKPHFNFEIIDKDYLYQLSDELGFNVEQNYHLFLKE